MADGPAYGTPDAAADVLAELAGGVIAHAAIVQSYAELRHWPGLEYAARCTVAYLRAMAAATAEIERSRAVAIYRASAENIGPGEGL